MPPFLYLLTFPSYHPTATFLKLSLFLTLPTDPCKFSFLISLPPVSLQSIQYTANNVIFLKIKSMFIRWLATFNGPPPDYGTKSKFLRMTLKILPHLPPTYFSRLISWHSLIQILCPSQTKLFTVVQICHACLHLLYICWSLCLEKFFPHSFF